MSAGRLDRVDEAMTDFALAYQGWRQALDRALDAAHAPWPLDYTGFLRTVEAADAAEAALRLAGKELAEAVRAVESALADRVLYLGTLAAPPAGLIS